MIGALLLCSGILAAEGQTKPMTKDDAVQVAKETLRRAGVSGEAPRMVSAIAMKWPDARLGCGGAEPPSPSPVAGYRVVMQAGRRVYRVHVAEGIATVCGAPFEVAPAVPAPDGDAETGPVIEAGDSDVEALVGQARTDLAAHLSVPADTIELVKFREVTWPDGSLGCPQPGLLYTQVLAPGYLIALRVAGRRYEYHGARGGKPFLCTKAPSTS